MSLLRWVLTHSCSSNNSSLGVFSMRIYQRHH